VNWQEYQTAIARLYEQAEGIGQVQHGVTIPDKVTGQPRQVDTLIEIEAKGHYVRILVDAKFHKDKLDVKTVEEVAALATAVSANKAVIVCANDWTKPAKKFADFCGIDLRIVSIEEAVELLDPNKWKLCPACECDCIIMDQEGFLVVDGLIFWWLAGQCRECKAGLAWCQECGQQMLIGRGKKLRCRCGHTWAAKDTGMTLRLRGSDEIIELKYWADV
jgi:hypothetical protein